MWRPRNWTEVEALKGVVEETPSLDFKKAVTPKNDDIASDIAAMTVNGGVLIYGVDENKETRVASDVPRVPLNGLEERLRSIAGSRITPTPSFDVEIVRENDDDPEGVVLLVIPPSPIAPHQVNNRYPCRSGTTNAYLSEPEVDRLYAQRRLLAGPPPSIDELLDDDFVVPPGADGLSVPTGVGQLALVVRAVASDFVHPHGAWQEEPLSEAIRAALRRQSQRFNNIQLTRVFSELSSWVPMQAAGWTAGSAQQQPSEFFPQVRYGATLTYPGRLSFLARWGLVVTRGDNTLDGRQELYRSAREFEVIRDLTAFLAIASEYFAEVNGAGVLVAGARLAGFGGAKSECATGSAPFPPTPASGLPAAPDGVSGVVRQSALSIRDEPERTSRAVIERWLPQFYRDEYGRDAFELIVASRQTA